ncbi:hypothetical protein HELRODRAFT_159578 [Helobdella robusta]|uniref:RING-type domain-containing protein n=1 Tax=Helobdella robusta TaxID=6412 RepID=T1EP66_HELRO|nr:hypothetical protein HELRODRAFT_159578 [Helobdella robusta]ESO12984.1 hypothetical protein HELRODRAFT_159578 [Helobdella robusta]
MNNKEIQETCKMIICTLCGATIRDPVTNANCFDVFCKFCIEDYFEKFTSYQSSLKSSKNVGANVTCPVCGKVFHHLSLVTGFHKDNPVLKFIQKKSMDGLLTDKVRIKNYVVESTDKLTRSESALKDIILRINYLHDQKVKDLDFMKQKINGIVNEAIQNIKNAGSKLFSQIDNIKSIFMHSINAIKQYCELVQSSASKLLTSLMINYTDSVNEVFAGLNVEKILKRASEISKQPELISIPPTVMAKYSFEYSSASAGSLGELRQLPDPYVLPEKLFHENNLSKEKSSSKLSPVSNSVAMGVRRKWSTCLRDASHHSSKPSGVCFFNSNQNVAVTEMAKGTLLSLSTTDGKVVETIINKQNFYPLGLTRLETSGEFATIDKNSRTVSEVRNKFLKPVKTIFNLPQALGYYNEMFFVTDSHRKSLTCLNRNGRINWLIGNREENFFSSPNYLSVCHKHHRIFVSDENCLKIFDTKGNHVKSVSDPKWQLKGSCVDSCGNVIVVEDSRNRLMKFDQNGEYVNDLPASLNFRSARWVLRSALNFASDGEIVREVGREFQRKGPEKAKADLAKECLTRVKKKREKEDDRKPGRLGSINISDKYLGNNLD